MKNDGQTDPPRDRLTEEHQRILLVNDGTAWFVRRVAVTEEDWTSGYKVYRCDKHLGGPYETLAAALRRLPRRVR